jgi:hypothetical protein
MYLALGLEHKRRVLGWRKHAHRAWLLEGEATRVYAQAAATRIHGLWGQATKCMWWMPWRLQAMKDVAACEKLRGAGKRALIRRCPNGETRPARVTAV